MAQAPAIRSPKPKPRANPAMTTEVIRVKTNGLSHIPVAATTAMCSRRLDQRGEQAPEAGRVGEGPEGPEDGEHHDDRRSSR